MGKQTGIEWTDATWNPWQGCRKVSAGCKNCYMYSEKHRFGQNPSKPVRSSPATFKMPLKWAARNPGIKRVFTCSWSDFFIEEADPWREEAWSIIRQTPGVVYQILTKRIERVREQLPWDWRDGYPNVWLGVSVENQAAADERIPLVLQTPAAKRFLSCEPLLGPINLNHVRYIDWVICGGESGPGARPMDREWARSLRDQCKAAGVAFFMKQMGSIYGPNKGHDIPPELSVKEFPS